MSFHDQLKLLLRMSKNHVFLLLHSHHLPLWFLAPSQITRTKMPANPASSRAAHKDLYPWASSELLDEYSCLLSTRALREHVGEECSYNRRAFVKRHDDDIIVLPCSLGEPVCGDERSNNGVPFFYFYQVVFKCVGVRLPFSRFERELLTEMNTAPAQLYPNSWAFVKAFDILFGFLGCAPSVDIFLHFFEVKR